MITFLAVSAPGIMVFSGLFIAVLLAAFFGGVPKVVDSINRRREMDD